VVEGRLAKYKRSQKKTRHDLVPPTGIVIADSPGKGRGVFAAKKFRKGDVIEIAPVLDLGHSTNEYDLLDFTNIISYVFQTDDDDGKTHSVVGLGYASLYNHSREPNADWRITTNVFVIKAVQTIDVGDEIYIDYGWDDETLKCNGIEEKS
jgi:SET domain-containing protein